MRTMFSPVVGTHEPLLPSPGVNALHGTWILLQVVVSAGSDSSTEGSLQSAMSSLLQRPLSVVGIVSSMPSVTPNFPEGEAPRIENSRPPYVRASRQVALPGK